MTDSLRPGVLLDVDGTLLDTNYLHTIAWWQALRETGHDGPTMAAIHRAVGISSHGLVERLIGTVDEKAVERHDERYAEQHDRIEALPGAADLIEATSALGLTVVLATSGSEDDLDWMLPAIGARESVDGVTTSSEVEQGKPAPDIVAAALEQHRLDPERSVLVGDTAWDVKAAARAGIPCIGVTSGGVSEQELLDAGAVEVYAGAADLVDRIQESRIARLA